MESWEAAEIAKEHGLKDEAEGAAMWFNEVCYEAEWQQEEMPKYSKFLKRIEGGDLYYDFGADYYFLVRKGMTNESKKVGKKTVIKLTESDLKNIIRESVERFLAEAIDTNEADKYIDIRANSKKIMDNITAKYRRLYGSGVDRFQGNMETFFDELIKNGDDVPVKDVEAYEEAHRKYINARNVLNKIKRQMNSERPSIKDMMNGAEDPYQGLSNRI